MKVTFIRHTKVGIPRGICYGWTDVPVADTFEQEAAETLRNLGENKFDKVYTSPLTRAVKLAEYCGHGDAQRDERLKEMNMGDWEMQKFDEITIAVYFNLISIDDVISAIEHRAPHVEVVVTGRYAPQRLIDIADLVTEMKEIQHYYTRGILSRDGIDR